MAKNLLVTGRPGVGKTTFIRKICEELKDLAPVGFYTVEIREAALRSGFELISLDGKRKLLSHTGIKGPHRVGRYGVDVRGFDEFLASIPFFAASTRVIVIDEIGKMESFSERFKCLLRQVLDSEKPVLATITQRAGGFIETVKKRRDVQLLGMTEKNREALRPQVVELMYEAVERSRIQAEGLP